MRLRSANLARALTGLLAVMPVLGMELKPYEYREDFEGVAPRVTLWAKNGESTENFIGVSEERAFAGKKALKLDVTLQGGSYHYWGVQLRVPCEGRLTLSARVFVDELTTAQIGFGTNMVYPPTRHSGCGPAKKFGKPTTDWELVEMDLVERGKSGRRGVLARYTTTVNAEHAGAVMDRWAVFVYGGKGKRAVVYIDDVRIEGEAPSEAGYEAEVEGRFAAARKRFDAQLAQWREELAIGKTALASLADVAPAVQDLADRIVSQASGAEQLLNRLAKTGYASPSEAATVRAVVAAMTYGPATVAAIAKRVAAGIPLIVFPNPRPITDDRVPDCVPLSGPIAAGLTLSACRGEYESVSAAVYALRAAPGLSVRPSVLRGPDGVIPAADVDVSLVKWWYQGEGGIGYSAKKVYKPELLLKDERLVRVDREGEENYLRSTAVDGAETYLLCSGKTSDNLAGVRPLDAATLLPVDLPAKSLREFWVTVHVPDDAKPGVYTGTISFAAEQVSTSLPVRLTVHPFELAPSRLIYSIYYRAKLSPDGEPTIGSERKSEEQYRAEIADMKAHGVPYPANYQGWDERLLRRVLEIRREVGMPPGPFYNLGQSTGSTTDPKQLAELRQNVSKWLKLCSEFGYTDVYFYGIDEAKDDRLKSQRATWGAVQEAGGKTFVACYMKTFEAMGALLNCAVLAHGPDPREADKWHSVGSHAFCYANPQVGVEWPQTYRRNFGLVLWQAGFDGAMDYAYQHGFHHVWNDFDDTRYRDHNFTYPTVNGVVGTLAWEGFREGVDDVRYVTTLENALAGAGADRRDLAEKARAWLAALEPKTMDLYEVREQLVAWITKLTVE